MTNSGFQAGGPPLPARRDGSVQGTPSAAARRNNFTVRHPEVPITARREGGRIVFEVTEPGRPAAAYDNADAMMDDLESRYPQQTRKKIA
jgi:hypothetical protein